MTDIKLKFRVTHDKVSICRLPSGSPIPMWAYEGDFFSITMTQDELSIICDEKAVPEGVKKEGCYRIIRVEGTLDFSLVGILAEISGRLAAKGISMFAISTYDTDYILVKERDIDSATNALHHAGHEIKR